jgi:hypothetical protein
VIGVGCAEIVGTSRFGFPVETEIEKEPVLVGSGTERYGRAEIWAGAGRISNSSGSSCTMTRPQPTPTIDPAPLNLPSRFHSAV